MGGDFGSNIAVLSSTGDAAAGGPDAALLDRAAFPSRAMPDVSGTRDSGYQLVFRQSVLNDIHSHGKASMEAEVCGVLIGNIYSDRLGVWGYVEHCIRGNNAVGRQTQVTITSETWTRIHETLESKYPDKKIIGWYHTHPGFGIFLSGMDLFIQDNFFNQPWQAATVYDPHSGEEGTFVWRAGKSVRETFLVENDAQGTPDSASTTAAFEQLTRRVKRLERKLDVVLTGLMLLVLLVLVAPLLLIAARPENLRRIPGFRQRAAPAPTTLPAHGEPPKAAADAGAAGAPSKG